MTNLEKAQQKKMDFIEAFGSARGVKALGHLSKFCLEHAQTFDPTSDRMSAFNEGARSVILEIRHWLNLDLSKYEESERTVNNE